MLLAARCSRSAPTQSILWSFKADNSRHNSSADGPTVKIALNQGSHQFHPVGQARHSPPRGRPQAPERLAPGAKSPSANDYASRPAGPRVMTTRHSLTFLFAALDIATGLVIGRRTPSCCRVPQIRDGIKAAMPRELDVRLAMDTKSRWRQCFASILGKTEVRRKPHIEGLAVRKQVEARKAGLARRALRTGAVQALPSGQTGCLIAQKGRVLQFRRRISP